MYKCLYSVHHQQKDTLLAKVIMPCCYGGNSTGVNSTSALLCGAKAVHVKYKQQLEDLRRVGLLVTEYYTK